MLCEPAPALTDLALGLVTLALAVALRSRPGVHRYWRLTFWWTGSAAVAGFFVAVFPGNVHHWRTGTPVPLMRSDRARFVRLFLQPVLIAWALWSAGPWRAGR